MVKNEAIRQNLSQKSTRLAEGIQNIITQIATKKAQMVTNLYVALCRRLSRKPRNIEECCQLTEFIEQRVEKYNVELQQNIRVMNEYYQLMDDLLVL